MLYKKKQLLSLLLVCAGHTVEIHPDTAQRAADRVAQQRVVSSVRGLFLHPFKRTLHELKELHGDDDKSGLAQILRDGCGAENLKNYYPNHSKRPDHPNFTIILCDSAGNGKCLLGAFDCGAMLITVCVCRR